MDIYDMYTYYTSIFNDTLSRKYQHMHAHAPAGGRPEVEDLRPVQRGFGGLVQRCDDDPRLRVVLCVYG